MVARDQYNTMQKLVALSVHLIVFTLLLCSGGTQASTQNATHSSPLETLALPHTIPPLALSQVSLWKWLDNHWTAIPHQFNEYDEEGNIWIEQARTNAAGPINTLDDSDKIIVIDNGAANVKQSLHHQDNIITSIVSASGATYYLRKIPTPDFDTQVEHSRQTGVTRTPYYVLSTNPNNEILWQSLQDARADDNSPPIIDALELEISAGILTSFSRVSLGPQNLQAEVIGSQSGPLRSTTSYHIKVIMLGIPVMTVDMQMSRYPAAITFSTKAKIPVAYRAIIRKPSVTIGLNTPSCENVAVSLGGTPTKPICPTNERHVNNISKAVKGNKGRLDIAKDDIDLRATLINLGDSPLPIEYYLHPSTNGLQGGYKMNHLPDDNIVKFFMSLDFSRRATFNNSES